MKKIIAALCAVLVIFSCAGCSGASGEYPVTLANCTLDEKPDSIVCLSDSIADILIACGYSDRITARSDECTQPEIAGVPTVGSKADPLTDKVLEAKPDIVFADKTISDEAYDKIKDSGKNILIMMPAITSEELTKLFENISAVADGNNTGRKNGREKIESLLMTLSDLQRLVPESKIVTTVCYIYDNIWNAAYDDSPAGRILSYTNAVNVCANNFSGEDTKKKILLSDPEFIFCADGVKAELEKDDDFKTLRAYRNNKVFEIDGLIMQRQGNSMTESLACIIEMMYPELSSPQSSEDDNTSKPQESSEPEESSKPQESSNPDEASKPQESSNPDEASKPQESSEPEESSTADIQAEYSINITDGLEYGIGADNDDVYKIQQRLSDLGYFDYEPTGYYGEKTEDALISFEAANGLDTDGYASNSDLKLLFSADANPNS